ncbi:hypothetical protein [Enterobacter roggenkampii]|uniref:hypothetical protein n=1 Tax=Enterobacter roggenkampii TaxID=1812935 RepID=UPI00132FADC3|nr:hypothetical protein [Enterobacter roggenkampii]
MGNLDNGGYAFPIPNADFQTFAPNTIEEYKRVQSGMTLRDYLAAKALIVAARGADGEAEGAYFETVDGIASRAYLLADAMLKARG